MRWWPWGRGRNEQTLSERMNPVPTVVPAAQAYSTLGRWEPLTVFVGGAIAFVAADLLGALRPSDFEWTSVGLAVLAATASCFVAYTRGRDKLHDRLYLAKPVPDGTEIKDEEDDGRLGTGLVYVGLWGVVLLGVTEAAHAMDGNEAHVFLFFAWILVSVAVDSALGRSAVEEAERERGVRMYRIDDTDRYEDVTGEDLGDSDPGPMFTGR